VLKNKKNIGGNGFSQAIATTRNKSDPQKAKTLNYPPKKPLQK
jgi:hypothetical protein